LNPLSKLPAGLSQSLALKPPLNPLRNLRLKLHLNHHLNSLLARA